MSLTFDLLLALALFWIALRTLTAPRLDHAIVLFIAFGLLMTLAWARLSAPDIGLAEAAIGAGLTGALLLDAYGAMRGGEKRVMRRGAVATIAVTVLAMAFAVVLMAAMLELGTPAVDLRVPVVKHLAESGVSHPVTAVLLNYRGYDTLLEIAVLLIALLAILFVLGDERASPARAAHPILQTLARLATPAMVVVAIYLLWAGAFRPGGAFQAGAVLAAAAVLLHLAGLTPGWGQPRLPLRIACAAGFLVFLAVSAALLTQGALLTYPPDIAGGLILLIEGALTISLATTLAGLFLFLSREEEHS